MSSPAPPPLPHPAARSARPFLAGILSLILMIFLGSGTMAFLNNSLILFWNRQDLAILDGITLLLMLGAGFLTFSLMTLFPAIPKRIFLPVSLFLPLAGSALTPLLIRYPGEGSVIVWTASWMQLALGLFLVRRVQGSWTFRWPLFPERRLSNRKFGLGNIIDMALVSGCVLLPAVVFSAACSAALAVDHFTDGFVALRPAGITMQVRKYVREDGKTVLLVPMSHIGESKFYRDLTASFPADAVILMEGVTDHDGVTPVPIDYSRAAAAVGAVEQRAAFKPRGEIVPADVDMSTFSPGTLEVLKVAMLIHSKGVTAETLPFLMKPAPPGLERLLIDDLLTKRNRHLLGVLEQRLPTSENIVVPWGAAHMPEIARQIQKLGFRQTESREYVAIRFGS